MTERRKALIHCTVVSFLVWTAAAAAQERIPPPAGWTPNAVVQVNRSLAERLAATTLDRVEVVRDNILDTDIYGTGRTRGVVAVEFVPCDRAAVIDLVMTAQTQSRTVGYHGPVQLHNTTVSSVTARKRVAVDADGVRFGPAQSWNRTDSGLDDITTKFRRPLIDDLVRRAAYRRFARDEELARQISEEHMNERVRTGFDQDADPRLIDASRKYRQNWREPLEKSGITFDQVALQTTARTLTIRHRLAGAGAAAPPPEPTGSAEASARLHESYVNAVANILFSGKTYSAESFREEFGGLFGRREPPPHRNRDSKTQLTITFADRDPVDVRFADGTVSLLIRAAEFQLDRDAFPAMWISAEYRLEATSTGVRALRRSEIAVAPPNHTPGTRLTSTQVSTKAVLRNHLEDMLQPCFELKEIKLPENLNKPGRLVPTEVRATRGWLLVGVQYAP